MGKWSLDSKVSIIKERVHAIGKWSLGSKVSIMFTDARHGLKLDNEKFFHKSLFLSGIKPRNIYTSNILGYRVYRYICNIIPLPML